MSVVVGWIFSFRPRRRECVCVYICLISYTNTNVWKIDSKIFGFVVNEKRKTKRKKKCRPPAVLVPVLAPPSVAHSSTSRRVYIGKIKYGVAGWNLQSEENQFSAFAAAPTAAALCLGEKGFWFWFCDSRTNPAKYKSQTNLTYKNIHTQKSESRKKRIYLRSFWFFPVFDISGSWP